MNREMKIGIVGALICAILLGFGISDHEWPGWWNHTKGNANPVAMDGRWHQTNGTDALYMAADVEHGVINIELTIGSMTGVYWNGSFDTDQMAGESFIVTSQSNKPDDLFASHNAEKQFTYDNGVLSYQFTIRGTTQTVKLAKGA